MPAKLPAPEIDLFDDDDDGWEDMPIVRDNDPAASGLDEEDKKKYHYVAPAKKAGMGNATGTTFDVDDYGAEWREKATTGTDENSYTRLRMQEEDESDEVHLRTRYLFDDNKAMTPLSQMQATKNLLTEAQRMAYVGLCALTAREMTQTLRQVKGKELKNAIQDMELWSLKIMGRIYYHMELATEEQKMIDTLSTHGVQAADLAPALMTTHTVANPEYDPAEAKRQDEERAHYGLVPETPGFGDFSNLTPEPSPSLAPPATPSSASFPRTPGTGSTARSFQTTARVLEETAVDVPGVSTTLSKVDENVTLDIRWTVLCDLFLILIADSVYDARSRVLLEQVALRLGLGWLDVVKFERRVTEALEIQESVETMENQEIVEGRQQSSKKRRYVMMGLATLGGGLVIGLSAGLLAPVIGAGLGAAFTTIGVTGTTAFLGGAGGAAVITTGGVLTGSSIAVRGMARRTQLVRTFDLLPLHNNKRVNCILTVPGFMTSITDDVRLPFSVLDPVVGDVFSVLWEPEMIQEAGSALKILTGEVLSQLATTALQATVMTALMSALQWPIILTKLGYLIDNPWSNALDRAKAAGGVLADVLMQRHLGVRPITLIGFSLGARVIFYALLELARHKAFGIVQDVILLGTTVTAPTKTWHEARSAVSGRFVNGYARNDWVLNYLFRATSGGLHTVAGLRPVEGVSGLDNVDVTDKISGHMSYRTFMPLILDQLGFPVSADFFDEPEEPEFQEERIVVREGDQLPKKKGWFSRTKATPPPSAPVSRPPTASHFPSFQRRQTNEPTPADDDDLPPRLGTHDGSTPATSTEKTEADSRLSLSTPADARPAGGGGHDVDVPTAAPVAKAGFDFGAIKAVIGKDDLGGSSSAPTLGSSTPLPLPPAPRIIAAPTDRPDSAPPAHARGGVSLGSASATRASLEHRSPSAAGAAANAARSTARSGAPSTDLASRFARSVSMSHMRGEDEEEEEAKGAARATSFASTRGDPRDEEPQVPSAPLHTLTFADSEGYGGWGITGRREEPEPYGLGLRSDAGADPWAAERARPAQTFNANPWQS